LDIESELSNKEAEAGEEEETEALRCCDGEEEGDGETVVNSDGDVKPTGKGLKGNKDE
jgi:hypothetical protein